MPNLTITPRELFEMGWWERYCNLSGTSVWACNEGLLSASENLDVPKEMFEQVVTFYASKNRNVYTN